MLLEAALGIKEAISFGITIFDGVKKARAAITGNTILRRVTTVEAHLEKLVELQMEQIRVTRLREVERHSGGRAAHVDPRHLMDEMLGIQRTMGLGLAQSEPIDPPDPLLRVFRDNPERLLSDIKPLAGVDFDKQLFEDPTWLPVIFDKWGVRYVGWIKEGSLSGSLDTDYRPELAERIGAASARARQQRATTTERTARGTGQGRGPGARGSEDRSSDLASDFFAKAFRDAKPGQSNGTATGAGGGTPSGGGMFSKSKLNEAARARAAAGAAPTEGRSGPTARPHPGKQTAATPGAATSRSAGTENPGAGKAASGNTASGKASAGKASSGRADEAPPSPERAEAEAQFRRGETLLAKDAPKAAAECLAKAAELGHAAAQNVMGYSYLTGRGVARDAVRAAALFRQAADQGDLNAIGNFADCLRRGVGTEQDHAEALRLYRQAADLGNLTAINGLAIMTALGQGRPADPYEAARLLHLAANAGDRAALYNLGDCYAAGRGVPTDLTAARTYFQAAADKGHAKAAERLRNLD